jgi:molecular chaperone GrpE
VTDANRRTDPATPAGSASRPAASATEGEALVIRDNRKIDADGKPKMSTPDAAGENGAQAGAEEPVMGQPAPEESAPAEDAPEQAEVVTGEVEADAPETAASPEAEAKAGATKAPGIPAGLMAEMESLRSELDERLRDLQRVTAEYSNYRKRVERDRGLVTEQAVAGVLASLLPILDDVDRAREHDDLAGPYAAMAEQLVTVLGKFNLTGFGEPGDEFDPTRHEAVTHEKSAEVKKPTCVAIMRRGYLLGDRLLRPALVAVADPE